MKSAFRNFLILPAWAENLKRPFLFSLKVGIATALLSLLMPNQYRSEARILPSDSTGMGMGNLAGAAAAVGMNLPTISGGLEENAADILQSRWICEQLLRTRFDYHLKKWYIGPTTLVQGTLFDYFDKANLDKAINALTDKYDVSQDQKTKLITLSVETRSADLSQQVAQKSVHLLEQFLSTNARTKGGEKAAFAKARMEDARRELEKAENTYRRFLASHLNSQTSIDPDTRIQGDALSSEVQLRRQLLTTLSINQENALMEAKNDLPIVNILDQGHFPEEHSKPRRGLMVLAMMVLAAGGYWVKTNWEWVRARLSEEES